MALANGGILTHPDRPGINLDPVAMQASLVYLDTANVKMGFRSTYEQCSAFYISALCRLHHRL